jgi:hypothetical protein
LRSNSGIRADLYFASDFDAGRQPPELTAHRLIRTVDLPIAWAAQKQLLGIP